MDAESRRRLESPEAFRLFYRALADGEESAWADLYRRYHALAASWVRRHPGFRRTGESPEFFVNAAFTKMMAAMRSPRFAGFDDVSAMLGYLRMCAASAVVDQLRRREPPPAHEEEEPAPARVSDAETDAVGNIERQELWRTVAHVTESTAERLLVYESFVNGSTPKQIRERWPDFFDSVESVYTDKRNLLSRLRRHPRILAYRRRPRRNGCAASPGADGIVGDAANVER